MPKKSFKDLFSSFRLKSVDEQRKVHEANLKRSLTCARQRILDECSDAAELAERLTKRASALTSKIDRAEDRVANAADRKYGPVNWRRNRRLLQKVCVEMWAASAPHRTQRDELLERAKIVLKPRDELLEALDEAHRNALTAAQHGELDRECA